MNGTMGLIAIVLLSFALRIPFSRQASSDSYWHLWLIKQRKRFGFQHRLTQAMPEGDFGYPSLHHWIVSFLPRRLWVTAAYALNYLYDILAILLVYEITIVFFEKNDWPMEQADQIAFFAALLFSTSPILFPVHARLTGAGARTLGGFLSFVYFSCSLLFFLDGNGLWLFPMMMFGVLTILASTFGMQVMVLTSLALSFALLSWWPTLLVVFVFLFSLLLRPFQPEKVLRYSLDHYLSSYDFPRRMNELKDYLRFPGLVLRFSPEALHLLTRKLSFFIAAYSLPLVFVLLALYVSRPEEVLAFFGSESIRVLFLLVVASAVPFFLTLLKPLQFLGQPERYLELTAPFLSILCALLLFRLGLGEHVFVYLLLGQVFIVLLLLWFVLTRPENSVRKENMETEDEVLCFLNRSSQMLRVLTVPVKLSFLLGYLCDNEKLAFYHPYISTKAKGFPYHREDGYESQTSAVHDIAKLQAKYGLTTVVVERRLEGSRYLQTEIEKSKLVLLERSANFLLYTHRP